MTSLLEKQYSTRNGVIKYWTTDNPRALTVFLLHGAAMDHNMFNDQLEILAEYNVIAWDARGHGKSRPINDAFTISDLADDAVGILKELKIATAVFVGQSEGGMIAQEIYRLHPTLVKGIVAIGSSPIMLTYTAFDVWLLNFSTSIIKLWPYRHFATALAKKTAIQPAVRAYAHRTVSVISKQEFITIWKSAVGSLSKEGYKDMHITVPLLITYGDKDTTGAVKQNNIRWKNYEKNAQLVVIPKSGHNANQDNPTFFNNLLKTFIVDNF